MADLLQPLDLTQFRAFTSGDEHALVRIYRTQYDALLEQAREALGPDLAHFSGRVAQQAMLATWDHRGRYENVNGLTDALTESIRTEAALQRRKHLALHHGGVGAPFTPHVTVPTADEAVDALLAELHAAPVDHAAAMNEVQAARKHHAAEHVHNVGRTRGWVGPVVLGVVAVVAIVVLMRWVDTSSAEVAATKALEADNARSLSSARGQRGNVTLNDGSTAKIGSDSRLKLPNDFGGLVRTLELYGTAMFTVAPNATQPFVVRAGNAIVTATGTAFTVRAYEEDSIVYIGVQEGSVSVRVKNESDETALTAGQALRMAGDGSVQMLDDVARQQALSWVTDTLIFTDVPVKVVLPELLRWFDLKASLADPALGERKVSLTVGLQSSGDALKALAGAAMLKVGFDKEDRVLLSDSVAVGAPTTKKR